MPPAPRFGGAGGLIGETVIDASTGDGKGCEDEKLSPRPRELKGGGSRRDTSRETNHKL